jgi:hypothetical protein
VDSIEVAVRFTEAIMVKSGAARKGADLAESYVHMFAEVLKRVNIVMNPRSAVPTVPRDSLVPQATVDIFPLTHEQRE